MKLVRLLFVLTLCIFSATPTFLVAEDHSIQHRRPLADASPHWVQELKSHVKQLSHDIDTFHWTTTKKMSAVSGEHKQDGIMFSYIQKYLGYYNAPITPGRSDSAGPGLYLASDPVATLYYAGIENWALIKIPFKKNTTYLEMRDDFEVPFSKEAREELKALGCEIHYSGGSGTGEIRKVDDMTREPSCRALFVNAMKRFGVSLLAYTYTTQQYEGVSVRPRTCFVLASDKDIQWEKTKTYTADFSFEMVDDIRDQALINTAFRTAVTRDAKLKELLPSLIPWPKTSYASKEDFVSYARDKFFGSDKYPEDGTAKDKDN